MTMLSTHQARPVAFALVRNLSGTAWQTVTALGFMIMIGLVGSHWLPWLVAMVNSAAV